MAADAAASSALVGSSTASDSRATDLAALPPFGPATYASKATEVKTTSSLTSTSYAFN